MVEYNERKLSNYKEIVQAVKQTFPFLLNFMKKIPKRNILFDFPLFAHLTFWLCFFFLKIYTIDMYEYDCFNMTTNSRGCFIWIFSKESFITVTEFHSKLDF